MTEPRSIEERLQQLERDVAELNRRLRTKPDPKHWLDRVSGSMVKYPEFQEVLRLGRETRLADRPEDSR